jgi:hypothetical protein
MHGVPKSTLHDLVTGKGATIGRFTPEEEETLVRFITNCAHIGYPKTSLDVGKAVQI